MAELKLLEDAVEWREADNQIVAMAVASGEYFGINGSGVLLWRLLLKGSTLRELSEELMRAYEVDRSTAEEDVHDFVSDLSRRGLLDASA